MISGVFYCFFKFFLRDIRTCTTRLICCTCGTFIAGYGIATIIQFVACLAQRSYLKTELRTISVGLSSKIFFPVILLLCDFRTLITAMWYNFFLGESGKNKKKKKNKQNGEMAEKLRVKNSD